MTHFDALILVTISVKSPKFEDNFEVVRRLKVIFWQILSFAEFRLLDGQFSQLIKVKRFN